MPGPRSIRSIQHGGGGAPPSPTLSATTRASLDFPSRPALLITRADLRNSLNAYEKLLTSAKAYTNAMLAMAKASSDFACALEECARVKGAHDSGPGLQAASGLHFLKSNYEQVLCDTFWKDFSIPLLSHYDTYRAACHDRQLAHDKAISEKSKQLKEAEARNMRTGRRKERDLNQFRRALQELQAHVDELDELKAHYYHEVLESEEEVWELISGKVALVVRSQIEISERISSKGLSDPILEPMLSTIPDPFGTYGPPKQDDQIFSILPPTSLLSSAANSVHGGGAQDGMVGPSSGINLSNGASGSSSNLAGASSGMNRAGGSGPYPLPTTTNTAIITPASLMSPTTPSKGLSRQAHPSSPSLGQSSDSQAGQRQQGESWKPSPSGESPSSSSAQPSAFRGHAPQLSTISDATTSISTSDSSVTTTGLFGSESVDFEELLDRDRGKRQGKATDGDDAVAPRPSAEDGDGSDRDGEPGLESGSDAGSTTLRAGSGGVTAASRLKHVLSIIDEDGAGPLASSSSNRTLRAEPSQEAAKVSESEQAGAETVEATEEPPSEAGQTDETRPQS